ncbi:MAG: C-GCAxxG-C-C family (seleno)protein, partial [bacterium]
MNKQETAVALKHGGMNCAQAVLLAFQEESGLDAETLKKLGAPFGVGMGGFDATCGSLLAAGLLLGLKNYEGKPILRDARALADAFRA